jgi:hypothetical protein
LTWGQAKTLARKWVLDHAAEVPALQGVLLAGSAATRPDAGTYDPLSDIDLWHLVSEDVSATVRQRKLVYEGVLLEPAYLPYRLFQDAETVLGSWLLAGHLSVPSVILDPAGRLRAIQETVAREYPKPERIRQRCDSLVSELKGQWLPRVTASLSLADRLFAFGYAVTSLQQLPLLACLDLPTIRRSGMLFTQRLKALGQERLGEKRLTLMGSATMSRGTVEELLASVIAAYDDALATHRTPTPFDYDLSPASRPFMVDGARDLIDRGYHRESLPWILFMLLIAFHALVQEAPEKCAWTCTPACERFAQIIGVVPAKAAEEKVRFFEEVLAETRSLAERLIEALPAHGRC